MKKNKLTITAVICLGVAVVVFFAINTPLLFRYGLDIGILNFALPFVFTVAAVVYGVRAVKLRRSVWNWVIVVIASALSMAMLFVMAVFLLIYGISMPDDPPWPNQDELENTTGW